MKIEKGPEDEPSWKDVAPTLQNSAVVTCRKCKVQIGHWHCADTGCPWCASCGAKAQREDTK